MRLNTTKGDNSDRKYGSAIFVWFIALPPSQQLSAMVMLGRSVHLTTPFYLGKLEQAVNPYLVHILSLVTDNSLILNESAEGRRMTVEIIS